MRLSATLNLFYCLSFSLVSLLVCIKFINPSFSLQLCFFLVLFGISVVVYTFYTYMVPFLYKTESGPMFSFYFIYGHYLLINISFHYMKGVYTDPGRVPKVWFIYISLFTTLLRSPIPPLSFSSFLFIHLSVHPSIHPFIYPLNHPLIHSSIHSSICPSIHSILSIYLSIHLFIHPSIH